jgi:hypothetical protein
VVSRASVARGAVLHNSGRARSNESRRSIVTLGGWPWPNYELELSVSREGNALCVHIAHAELRRTHTPLAPCFVLILREFLNEEPAAIEDLWLLPAAVYRMQGPGEAPNGWLVLAGTERRPRVQARGSAPEWLALLDVEQVESPPHIGLQRDLSLFSNSSSGIDD